MKDILPDMHTPSALRNMTAVVVVNWNGVSDTLNCYKSVCSSIDSEWVFICVDNASTDGSISQLSTQPGILLLQQSTNLGFAGGCNVGIKHALSLGAEYIFLLNNDALVQADTLATLQQWSQRFGDMNVLGCTVHHSRTGELQFSGSRVSPISGDPQWFTPAEGLQLDDVEAIESDFVFGAALFAPRRIFQQVGLLDERFFLTYEETDWCYRARGSGARCFVIPQAKILHHGSVSLGASTSPLQTYFLHRNKLLFLEKHATFRQWIRALRFSLRMMRKSPVAGAIARALLDYALRRFGDSPRSVRRMAQPR